MTQLLGYRGGFIDVDENEDAVFNFGLWYSPLSMLQNIPGPYLSVTSRRMMEITVISPMSTMKVVNVLVKTSLEKKAVKISSQILGIVQEVIDHQEGEGDHKKQEQGDDQFDENGKPNRLVTEGGLKKKDQQGCHDQSDDSKGEGELD